MTTNQKTIHADTEDKGRGFWKNGKWCQSPTTKKANNSAIKERRVARLTGREAVCDE